ncbi:hypothetical protein CBR_g6266 [Chara braunii]|uniref:Uncharacterized protein n=1 Tax=Chara braunii TaxID=69332 RepID=A0A388KJ95_CHABU|nr:hypothetical protein CBR_g6266 [Chara braunii]|eukprot:GBG70135.1 hypothetical protein CBR_g6266 [Chara braunii]
MHLWTSASPAERNWAQHERINTTSRSKLGVAKLAQLVEIATNLKLAACTQQGGGYVLSWVMGTGRVGTAGGEEDDEGDLKPEVWGARPAGSVSEQDIERQVVAFHACRPSRTDLLEYVFGKRATELRPWPEYTAGVDGTPDPDADDDTSDDQWTDDDDAAISSDTTTERVYFTYGGGSDGMASHTSVMTDDVPSGGQASGIGRTGRRWEVRSDSEPEREGEEGEVPCQDRRYSPSHHRTTGPPNEMTRSARLASAAEKQRTHDSKDREGARPVDMPDVERTPSGAGLRPHSPPELSTDDFDVGGSGGGLGDLSAPRQGGASTSELCNDDFDERDRMETAEERDAQLDREEEERLMRGRESGVVEGGSGCRSDDIGSAGSMPPPPARAAEAVDEETTVRAHIGGSLPPVRGGVAGGWEAHRRVTDRLRADYGVGRGAFAGRLSPQSQAAEGGSGRLSLHMVGHMLGLSRSATGRSSVAPTAGTSTDMRQGQHYTSGEEGLMMHRGTRRHSAIMEDEARLAEEIAVVQVALDVIRRQRKTIAAEEAEAEDADTESEPIDSVVHRHRSAVAAATPAAQATYISGAQGTGVGSSGGDPGGAQTPGPQ